MACQGQICERGGDDTEIAGARTPTSFLDDFRNGGLIETVGTVIDTAVQWLNEG